MARCPAGGMDWRCIHQEDHEGPHESASLNVSSDAAMPPGWLLLYGDSGGAFQGRGPNGEDFAGTAPNRAVAVKMIAAHAERIAKRAADSVPISPPSPAETPWRDAVTAPRNGSHFLATQIGRGGFGIFGGKSQDWCAVVHWWGERDEEGFYLSSGASSDVDDRPVEFTHWTPLPARGNPWFRVGVCSSCGGRVESTGGMTEEGERWGGNCLSCGRGFGENFDAPTETQTATPEPAWIECPTCHERQSYHGMEKCGYCGNPAPWPGFFVFNFDPVPRAAQPATTALEFQRDENPDVRLEASTPSPTTPSAPTIRHDVRFDEGQVEPDGTIDEVVGTGIYHAEMMNDNTLWMQLGDDAFHVTSRGTLRFTRWGPAGDMARAVRATSPDPRTSPPEPADV